MGTLERKDDPILLPLNIENMILNLNAECKYTLRYFCGYKKQKYNSYHINPVCKYTNISY